MVKGKSPSRPRRGRRPARWAPARSERATLPLVGRADEMAVLARALTDVRAGRGRLVDIVGAPGIGKSRLVAELLSGVEDIRVVVVAV